MVNININYYKLAYYNFLKQSKAKQSKAKPLLYLLTNNLNFYILQFFKAFNFLSVFIRFAKNQFAILNNNVAVAHCVNNLEKKRTRGSPCVPLGNPLLFNFLTSITFDNLSEKIKNLRLVINFKFIYIRRIFT